MMADLWILLVFLFLLALTMGMLTLFARFLDDHSR